MAGPATDSQLQQLLEQSHPATRVTCPTPAVTAAWATLVRDLHRGGWTRGHRQAVVCEPVGAGTSDVLTITMMWSATHTTTGPSERRLTQARASTTEGAWSASITAAPGG